MPKNIGIDNRTLEPYKQAIKSVLLSMDKLMYNVDYEETTLKKAFDDNVIGENNTARFICKDKVSGSLLIIALIKNDESYSTITYQFTDWLDSGMSDAPIYACRDDEVWNDDTTIQEVIDNGTPIPFVPSDDIANMFSSEAEAMEESGDATTLGQAFANMFNILYDDVGVISIDVGLTSIFEYTITTRSSTSPNPIMRAKIYFGKAISTDKQTFLKTLYDLGYNSNDDYLVGSARISAWSGVVITECGYFVTRSGTEGNYTYTLHSHKDKQGITISNGTLINTSISSSYWEQYSFSDSEITITRRQITKNN